MPDKCHHAFEIIVAKKHRPHPPKRRLLLPPSPSEFSRVWPLFRVFGTRELAHLRLTRQSQFVNKYLVKWETHNRVAVSTLTEPWANAPSASRVSLLRMLVVHSDQPCDVWSWVKILRQYRYEPMASTDVLLFFTLISLTTLTVSSYPLLPTPRSSLYDSEILPYQDLFYKCQLRSGRFLQVDFSTCAALRYRNRSIHVRYSVDAFALGIDLVNQNNPEIPERLLCLWRRRRRDGELHNHMCRYREQSPNCPMV